MRKKRRRRVNSASYSKSLRKSLQEEEEQVETRTVVTSSTKIPPKENDQYSGLKRNSAVETHVEAKFKEQARLLHQKVLGSVADKSSEAQTQNQLQPSVCPIFLSELSPTSVTQPISSVPCLTLIVKKLSPQKVKNTCISEAGNQSFTERKALYVPVVKTSIPDGYNWQKYGQKQVKSPKGSQSYYKCTFFDCCAKKIECSNHSGHVKEIVNKGTHNHSPPRKNNSTKKSRSGLSVKPILQSLCAALKPGKKPKFVVHAAGDVGISGDGYRWRKYEQKMVKGNPHPRNYYRCTSARCLVRKHIETSVDNANAVIITYKGVHDHDMPVPKKRHGPPSAPLVAVATPASMSNLPIKKIDALQS